jgi:hypothetical protein
VVRTIGLCLVAVAAGFACQGRPTIHAHDAAANSSGGGRGGSGEDDAGASPDVATGAAGAAGPGAIAGAAGAAGGVDLGVPPILALSCPTDSVRGPYRAGSSSRQVALQDPVTYVAGAFPVSLAVGDVDGDGRLDLLVGNGQRDDHDPTLPGPYDATLVHHAANVSVFLNAGNGRLVAPVVTTVVPGPGAIAFADVTHGARSDVLIYGAADEATKWNVGAPAMLTVLGNRGSAPLGTPNTFPAGSGSAWQFTNLPPNALAVGDWNGGGRAAVVALSAEGVVLMHSDGRGGFGAPATVAVSPMPNSVVTADLNGDGNGDLALATAAGVVVRLSDASGTFTVGTRYRAGADPISIVAGDLDGDGDSDLAVADRGGAALQVLLNAGDGTFAPAARYSFGDVSLASRTLALADLNGDGKLDLVASQASCNGVSILLNAGDGTFGGPQATLADASIDPRLLAFGDLNGDGRSDVIMVGGIVNDGLPASVSVFLSSAPVTP